MQMSYLQLKTKHRKELHCQCKLLHCFSLITHYFWTRNSVELSAVFVTGFSALHVPTDFGGYSPGAPKKLRQVRAAWAASIPGAEDERWLQHPSVLCKRIPLFPHTRWHSQARRGEIWFLPCPYKYFHRSLSFRTPKQQFLTQESMSSTFNELITVIHIIATA